MITDLGQRRARQAATTAEVGEVPATATVEAAACACIAELLERLPPAYARALRRVEFEGASLESAAAAEGISVTNLKQRRFRARAHLRELLEATCRICAAHGCLDCSCRREDAGSGAGACR